MSVAHSLLSHAQPSDVVIHRSSEAESNDVVDKKDAEVDARIAELIKENTVLQKVRLVTVSVLILDQFLHYSDSIKPS